MQKRRTAERILPAAVHGLHRVEKFREIAVLGKQIEIAPNGLLDVILEHGDDQLVLAPEIRIERPARETRRRRDGLDAGPADPLFLEDARRRLDTAFRGYRPGWVWFELLTSAHSGSECNSIQQCIEFGIRDHHALSGGSDADALK